MRSFGGGRWLIDRDGRLSAEGPAALVDPAPGITCEVIEPIVASVEPVVPAVDPAAGTTMPATAPGSNVLTVTFDGGGP